MRKGCPPAAHSTPYVQSATLNAWRPDMWSERLKKNFVVRMHSDLRGGSRRRPFQHLPLLERVDSPNAAPRHIDDIQFAVGVFGERDE